MSKMMKVIAMLLVIAAVVFVAGCANKAPATENNTTPATTVTTAETPTVTPTEVVAAENETTNELVTPAENVTTNESVVSPAENVTANVTENVTQVPTGGAPKSHNQRVIDLAKARTAANTT